MPFHRLVPVGERASAVPPRLRLVVTEGERSWRKKQGQWVLLPNCPVPLPAHSKGPGCWAT